MEDAKYADISISDITEDFGQKFSGRDMVLMFEGISEIGAHVKRNPCYLSGSRHSIRSYFFGRLIFLHTGEKCSELSSNIRTMGRDSNREAFIHCVYYFCTKLS